MEQAFSSDCIYCHIVGAKKHTFNMSLIQLFSLDRVSVKKSVVILWWFH